MDEIQPTGERGAGRAAEGGEVAPAADTEETKLVEPVVETREASPVGAGGPLTPTRQPVDSQEARPSAAAGAEVLRQPGPGLEIFRLPVAERPPQPEARRRVSLAERLREPEENAVEGPASKIRSRSRRDFLLLGAGALAAAGGVRGGVALQA